MPSLAEVVSFEIHYEVRLIKSSLITPSTVLRPSSPYLYTLQWVYKLFFMNLLNTPTCLATSRSTQLTQRGKVQTI